MDKEQSLVFKSFAAMVDNHIMSVAQKKGGRLIGYHKIYVIYCGKV